MARRINLAESEVYLKLLLYGVAGSTKTRTAGTAALDERTAPVLWLDKGGNPESLRDYEKVPDIIRIDKLEDYNPIYEWLSQGQPKDAEIVKVMDLNPPYKTVVVDGLTGTQRLSFGVVSNYTRPRPGSFPPSIEIQHFNKVLAQMTQFGESFFFNLDMHVIMTALESEKADQRTGTYKYGPLLWGQSAGELPGQALAVARMLMYERLDNRTKMALREVPEEVDSVAIFQASENFVAKDQYGGLPRIMYNPTITKVIDAISR